MKLIFQVLETNPSGTRHKVQIQGALCPTLGLQIMLGMGHMTVLNNEELATLRGLGTIAVEEAEIPWQQQLTGGYLGA
jgi:hypothetical protein